MKRTKCLLSIILYGFVCLSSFNPLWAQHWQEKVRGSWVITHSSQNGGLILVDNSQTVDIIVPPTSHTAVHQAAKFLAPRGNRYLRLVRKQRRTTKILEGRGQ